MARQCILKAGAPHGLHRLGITAHVFIDTWAHQGFAGVRHEINLASNITVINPKDKYRAHFWEVVTHEGWRAAFAFLLRKGMLLFTNRVFPMGHGAVLHYPDHPFRVWSYVNGHGETVNRDNPTDFLKALDELCKVIRRFIRKEPNAPESGLLAGDQALIEKKIVELTDEDPEVRLAAWLETVRAGHSASARQIQSTPSPDLAPGSGLPTV